MAFVAAQNTVLLNNISGFRDYGVLVLQTVYKTIVEAAEREKTVHNRASVYWFLDTTRNGGTYDAVPDSGDKAIYVYNTGTNHAALGMFLKNSSGETMFLIYQDYGFSIQTTTTNNNFPINPIIGNSDYSDNGHVRSFSSSSWFYPFYGLGISVSKNNFGGLVNPYENGFFSDGDLKFITDQCGSYFNSGIYSNGNQFSIIVGIDGKDILIDRRESYYNNLDDLLIYGDLIVTNDNTDTETDCIFGIQLHSLTSSDPQYFSMFRDKAGSTSFNPNGSNTNAMRYPLANVNTAMIDGSNANRIPYTGISFGWSNLNLSSTNSILNDRGVGYKGLSNLNKIRIVTGSSLITNKSVYNNAWCCIASFNKKLSEFKVLVAWDADNPAIQ